MEASVRVSGRPDEVFSDGAPERVCRADGAPVSRHAFRVLIIDGNLLTAEAFALAARHAGYAATFLSSVSVGRLCDELAVSGPDLAVIDIDFVAAATCPELVRVLRGAGVPVIAMGGRLEVLAECVNAGASYALDKRVPFSECTRIIGKVASGKPPVEGRPNEHFSLALREDIRARHARLAPFDILTYREKCVLAALMEGHSAEAIAIEGSVSISTVRSQIKAILQKLGVSSQLAATALAVQAGWTFGGHWQTAPR